MDIENIEDLKVSISETMRFIDECESIEINIEVFEEKLEVEVNPKVVIEKIIEKEENKFAVLILENLVDKLEFRKESIF